MNCKCCDEIEFWRQQNKKHEKELDITRKIFAKVSIYTWRKDVRKIKSKNCGIITSRTYNLNYCPECGRKLGD